MEQLTNNEKLVEIRNTLVNNAIQKKEFTQQELEEYKLELETLFYSDENEDIEEIYHFFQENKDKKERILFLIQIIKEYTMPQAKAKLKNLERQEKLIMILDEKWVTNKEYLIISRQVTLLRKYIKNKPFPYTKFKSNVVYRAKPYPKKRKTVSGKTPTEKENYVIGEPNKMEIFGNIFGSGSILYIKGKKG